MQSLRGTDDTDEEWMHCINRGPIIMSGKPVVKGIRLILAYLLNLLAQDTSVESILEEYDGLTEEDIQACLHLAAYVLA